MKSDAEILVEALTLLVNLALNGGNTAQEDRVYGEAADQVRRALALKVTSEIHGWTEEFSSDEYHRGYMDAIVHYGQ